MITRVQTVCRSADAATTCEDCGRIIQRDYANYINDYDDMPYCDSCIDVHRSNSIYDYSYKHNPIFYGDSNRYFGVELEINDVDKNSDNTAELLQISDRTEECIHIKSDGSLNSGMEIVTRPISLNYHKTKTPWKEVIHRVYSWITAVTKHQPMDCIFTSTKPHLGVPAKHRTSAFHGYFILLSTIGWNC